MLSPVWPRQTARPAVQREGIQAVVLTVLPEAVLLVEAAGAAEGVALLFD